MTEAGFARTLGVHTEERAEHLFFLGTMVY